MCQFMLKNNCLFHNSSTTQHRYYVPFSLFINIHLISFLGPLGPVFSDKIKIMQLQLLSMAESIPVDLLSTILTAMSETIYRNSVQNMFKDSEQDMFKDMKKDDSVEKQFSAILEEEEEEHVIEEPIKSEEVVENSSNYEVHTTVQETTYSTDDDVKLKEFIQMELAAAEFENTLNSDKSIDEPSSVDATEAIVESISENRAVIFEKSSSPENIVEEVAETIEILQTSEPVMEVIEEVIEEIKQEVVEDISIIEEVDEIADTNKDEVPNQDQIKEEIKEIQDIAFIEQQELKEKEPPKEIVEEPSVEVKPEIVENSSEKHEYTVQEKAHDLETFHDAALETNIRELVPVSRLKRFQKKFEDNSVFVSIKVKKSDEKIKEPEVIENVPIIQEVLEAYKKHAAEQEAIIQEALIKQIVQEEIVEDEETVIDEIPNEIPIEESVIEINEPNEVTVELTFPNSNETNKDVMEDSMSSSYTSDLSDKVNDVVFLQPKIKDNVDFYENYAMDFNKNIDSANDFMKNKSINQRLFNQQKVKTLDQSWQQLCENQKKVYK